MTSFQIDPDIRKAKTISSDFYTSSEYFERSKEKIFARVWQLVADTKKPTNLQPFTFLEGFMDIPLLLTRLDGVSSCMSNVCTHRGMILVDEPCSGDIIRCRYHGRRFSADGKFLSMPEFDGVEDFPSSSDDLRRVELEEWNTFSFASIDPLAPLADFVGGAKEAIAGVETSNLKLESSRDYSVKAHWALYCENYLEGFHIPFVHKSLNEAVDYGTYRTETFRYSSLQTAFDSTGDVAGRYLFVFPNMMFNFYAWGVSLNIVKPVSRGESVVSYLTYVGDESKLGGGAGADLHRVELEDEAVVESVQKGIRSPFYGHGRYSPTREQGTHHFHRLIAEFME